MPSHPPIRTDELTRAIALMARLRAPDGCPWDREQTFQSIQRHTLEEVYEVFDAIDRQAWGELRGELGDLLLQVLFYTQMAAEAGYFTLEEVAAELSAKLIRRHPHIFGDATATTPADVNRTWEAVKRQERAGQPPPTGLLADVPSFVPALLEAEKLGSRAARVGFDWPDPAGLLAKLSEETVEVAEELARDPREQARLTDELGDLFFTTVQLARHLHVDPEAAIRAANRKFRARFAAMEALAGGPLEALSAAELEALWQRAKAALSDPAMG